MGESQEYEDNVLPFDWDPPDPEPEGPPAYMDGLADGLASGRRMRSPAREPERSQYRRGFVEGRRALRYQAKFLANLRYGRVGKGRRP